MPKVNLPYFIASRLVGDRANRSNGIMTIIATMSVAIGVAVMIIALAVIFGFKREISSKIIGFASHAQIMHFDGNNSYEAYPILIDLPVIPEIESLHNFKHIQPFITKAGIIKTDGDIEGVLFKGINEDFDWSFFQQNIVEGALPIITDSVKTRGVLISKSLKSLLELNLGDKFETMFVEQNGSLRRDIFFVNGVYDTKLRDFDRITLICDMRHLQRLNSWDSTMISGFEVMSSDFDQIDSFVEDIDEIISESPTGEDIRVVSIKEKFVNIFDWLNLQDLNVIIIITIMFIVAGFNMIAALLIILLERTRMIGILKALGMINKSIQNIFIYRSIYIILWGLLIGNLLGLSLCFLQKHYGLITLDEATYFLSVVPIYVNWWHFAMVNAGVFVCLLLILTLPTFVVSKISPSTTIRYE